VTDLKEMMTQAEVLPVVTVGSVGAAVDLAMALQEGGIRAIEITLRTDCALEALREVKQAVPDIWVAAGTVTTQAAMNAVAEAGVDFAVSPGLTEDLVREARALELPYLPGVATPSEMLMGAEQGLTEFKLFPAAAVGGAELLQAIAAPLPDFSFCPTGGLDANNFTRYLKLPNVICVGGSWMAPTTLIERGAWKDICLLARNTCDQLDKLKRN
jgi:2-dehydro-3-deoxyphosphogluconate aldolase/(4S)-4-hydroxy-2-oxoglutarate aldolase